MVGTTIIGVLNLIVGLANSLAYAGFLVMLVLLSNNRTHIENSFQPTPHPSFDDDDEYLDIPEEDKHLLELIMDNIDLVKIVIYILLGASLLIVITASMLIHGVRQNRRGLLIPFVIQDVINLLLLCAFAVLALVVLGTSMVIVIIVIVIFVVILIKVYFLMVVISQYQALGLIRMHEEISMK